MSDLDVRLTALGDRLDLVTDGLVDDVLVRLDSSVAEPDGGHRRRQLRLAAAALLLEPEASV